MHKPMQALIYAKCIIFIPYKLQVVNVVFLEEREGNACFYFVGLSSTIHINGSLLGTGNDNRYTQLMGIIMHNNNNAIFFMIPPL